MIFTILTLFPEMFAGPLHYSILSRAQKKNLIKINVVNIRDFALDRYCTVDDRPYGGGKGMILKVDVLDRALTTAKSLFPEMRAHTILMDPKGILFKQSKARVYSKMSHLIIICGHYEGIDARVNKLVDEVVSVGAFVLTGGEIPAMVIIDCVTRLLPGVIREGATETESFTTDKLEAPQYTRPKIYNGLKVPRVLTQGNHAKITKWRKNHAKIIKAVQLESGAK